MQKENINNHIVNNFKIKIQKNINLYIIEHYISLNKKKNYLKNKISIKSEKNNKIKQIKIINVNKKSYIYFIENINIKYTNFKRFFFLINIKKIKTNIKLKTKKKSIFLNYNLLIFKKNYFKQHINIKQNKNTKSYQKYNNIFLNKSTYKLKSTVFIKKKSNNSIAEIIDNNLCINNHSYIKIIPKFSIYNRKSICKHEITITNINKKQIFYLSSRGFKIKNIKKIISLSFIKRILFTIKINKYIYKYIYKLIKIKLHYNEIF